MSKKKRERETLMNTDNSVVVVRGPGVQGGARRYRGINGDGKK